MGFFPGGLVVVNPKDPRVLGRKKCVDAASGATDVLERAVLVVGDEPIDNGDGGDGDETNKNTASSGLRDAIETAFGNDPSVDGPILICGTGMPVDMEHSRASQTYLEPRPFFQQLLDHLPAATHSNNTNSNKNSSTALNIAFCFGNERYGMAPADLAACDVVLGIPTHPSFGSLNLATAVQIIAYDWRQALGWANVAVEMEEEDEENSLRG